MYINNNTVVIQTFDEANAVFYAPVDADRTEGTHPAFYAATLCGAEFHRANDMDYRFETPVVLKYWEKLESSSGNRKLVMFDFNTGKNGTRSWYGYGEDSLLREDSTPAVQSYDKVAQEIARQGFSSFKFEIIDNFERVCRTVKVLHLKSKAEFEFDDMVDPNLYDDLRKWVEQKAAEQKSDIITYCARQFLNRAQAVG